MIIILAVCATLIATVTCSGLAAKAPLGYEDETGFHYGESRTGAL